MSGEVRLGGVAPSTTAIKVAKYSRTLTHTVTAIPSGIRRSRKLRNHRESPEDDAKATAAIRAIGTMKITAATTPTINQTRIAVPTRRQKWGFRASHVDLRSRLIPTTALVTDSD